LTFNFDGALIDFRKPKNLKNMTEKMGFQVDEQFTKVTQKERAKKGKNAYST